MTASLSSSVFDTTLAADEFSSQRLLTLRGQIHKDGHVSRTDIAMLFDIERTRRVHLSDWSELFCEALVQYMLIDTPPEGYMTDENARWLIETIGEKREARTDTELEALIRLIEKASAVPPFFAAYVLMQIKTAVIFADGPDSQGRKHCSGSIETHELNLIRRVLWGAGAEGHLAVSREEAEMLFDIADATTGNANDPDWEDLFARAIGNYLIGATGRAVPSRQDALRIWNTDYEGTVVSSLYKVLSAGGMLGALFGDGTLFTAAEKSAHAENARRDEAIARGAVLDRQKSDWLVERISRNGVTTGAEAALLAFLKREATRLTGEIIALIPTDQHFARP